VVSLLTREANSASLLCIDLYIYSLMTNPQESKSQLHPLGYESKFANVTSGHSYRYVDVHPPEGVKLLATALLLHGFPDSASVQLIACLSSHISLTNKYMVSQHTVMDGATK
jgi:hypothetical protein